MEVVLQNQDFRSIEIMENNLQLQKNEVSFNNFHCDQRHSACLPLEGNLKFSKCRFQDVSIQKTPMSSVDMFWNINRLSNMF